MSGFTGMSNPSNDGGGAGTSSPSSFTGMSSPSNDEGCAGTSNPSTSGLRISVKPGTSSSNDEGVTGTLGKATITIHSESSDEISATAVLLAIKKPRLTDQEMKDIIMNGKLSDAYINRAQKVLKRQFFHINGLESTILQGKSGIY